MDATQIIDDGRYPKRFRLKDNYFKDKNPEKAGLIPVYTGRKDDKIDSPKMVDMLAASANGKKHSQGQDVFLTIDNGHGAFGGDQTVLGVFDWKSVESVDADLIDIPGLDPLPKGSKWLMIRPEFYQHEYDNIKNGKYGYRFSVAFDEENGIFLNLAMCQVPAIEEVPEIKLRSVQMRSKGFDYKMEEKMITDTTIADSLKAFLLEKGMDAAIVDGIINILDDNNASIMLTLKPVDAAPAPAEPTTESVIKSLQDAINGMNEQLKQLEAKTTETPPVVEQLTEIVNAQVETVKNLETENTTLKTKLDNISKRLGVIDLGLKSSSKEVAIEHPNDKLSNFEKAELCAKEYHKNNRVTDPIFNKTHLRFKRLLDGIEKTNDEKELEIMKGVN